MHEKLPTETNYFTTPREMPGGIYCSSRCGFGCKREDYDLAVKDGAALAERMGEGWTSRVWENFGWHYGVTKGVATLRPNFSVPPGRIPAPITGYSAQFDTTPQVWCEAETAEDALGFALQEARGIERQIAADCAALSQ